MSFARDTVPDQFAVRRCGPLVMVARAADISDACFAESMEAIAQNMELHGRSPLGMLLTNFLADAKQRQLTAAYHARTGLGHIKRFALVSDHELALGVFSTVAWMLPAGGPPLRQFAMREAELALAWLHEAVAFELALARAHLAEMKAAVGV